jgi:uncharacterized protein
VSGLRSRAVVPTASASRYLQQLCKHWSHKAPVTFDPLHGRIELGFGVTELEAGPEALTITITHAGEGDPAQAQMVVAKHLDRFAFREGELDYDWQEVSEG